MSGLLERIVRRRRASASRRLGPPPSDRAAKGNGRTQLNGAASSEFISALRAAPTTLEVDGDEPTAPAAAEPATATAEPATATAEPATAIAEPPATAEPAPTHDVEPPPSRPSLRERGRIRRRIRYLQRLREVQLRDIGGFLVELDRFERERPDLVHAKIDSAAQTDAELRALEHALGERHPLRELREPGIGGACPECGAVHGSDDRFCASCGEPLREEESGSNEDPLGHGHVYPE